MRCRTLGAGPGSVFSLCRRLQDELFQGEVSSARSDLIRRDAMGHTSSWANSAGRIRTALLPTRMSTSRERHYRLPCSIANCVISIPWLHAGQQRLDEVDLPEQGAMVQVRRCTSRQEAEQYALVLAATGMQSAIISHGELIVLFVADRDAARATAELAAYDRENREPHDTPPTRDRPLPNLPQLEVALGFWAVLLFFFAASRHDAFSLDWIAEGAAKSGLMLGGEWWRAVTALCLHASSVHLLGNLAFGTIFLLVLAQLTGAGVAVLSMVMAGTVGNILSALIQSGQHTSIGASTAIFASLGTIVALRQSMRHGHNVSKLRSWTPVGAGFALLVFLGFSGKNTEIVAHVMGFGSGLVTGFLLSRWYGDWASDSRVQWICACAAGLILGGAWIAAATA